MVADLADYVQRHDEVRPVLSASTGLVVFYGVERRSLDSRRRRRSADDADCTRTGVF